MVTPFERPWYIDGFHFERPDMLVHSVMIPGSGAVTGCTGVVLPTRFLNINIRGYPVTL
jgi:hypothetical protein